MEALKMHVSIHILKLESKIGFLKPFCLRGVWGDMGDSDKSKKMISRSEMENFSLGASRLSRDFLNRFTGTSSQMENRFEFKEEGEDEDDEIELNLGLSLGGRFGVDKSSKKLMKSSSIAACLPVVKDDDVVAASPPPVSYPSLVRTSSLPVETEEEWRKRKELQTLRRMEAKRRRSQKQKNLKADREGGGGGGGTLGGEKREIEINLRGRLEKDQLLVASKKFSSSVAPLPSGMTMMGGSSSSELESRSLQGSSSCSDLSPVSIKSLQEGSSQDAGSSGTKMRDSAGRTSGVEADISKNQGKAAGTNASEDMPCVFTKGDGPNGRRVDGILYKYGKGEEVRIMCVCHGNFLSPAEFVKHAGGTDVTHPLKHIVINPNASPFV